MAISLSTYHAAVLACRAARCSHLNGAPCNAGRVVGFAGVPLVTGFLVFPLFYYLKVRVVMCGADRAVGKHFVGPAGALPVPVSDEPVRT